MVDGEDRRVSGNQSQVGSSGQLGESMFVLFAPHNNPQNSIGRQSIPSISIYSYKTMEHAAKSRKNKK